MEHDEERLRELLNRVHHLESRVTALLEANNRELERRRSAEHQTRKLEELVSDCERCQYYMENG